MKIINPNTPKSGFALALNRLNNGRTGYLVSVKRYQKPYLTSVNTNLVNLILFVMSVGVQCTSNVRMLSCKTKTIPPTN